MRFPIFRRKMPLDAHQKEQVAKIRAEGLKSKLYLCDFTGAGEGNSDLFFF